MIATASGDGVALVRSLGADEVIDYRSQRFQDHVCDIDVVLDTIGGLMQEASWGVMKPGGILVATAMPPPSERAAAAGVRAAFVFTPPRGAVLAQLAERVDAGRLRVLVGQEFALADAEHEHRLGDSGKGRGTDGSARQCAACLIGSHRPEGMLTLQLRPLDPLVSIQQQLGETLAPVVLINLFTVDAKEVDALLDAWTHDANWMKRLTRLHLYPAASRHRRQLRVPELCVVGIGCALSSGIHPPGVHERVGGLSVERGRVAAPVRQSGGAEPVHRLVPSIGSPENRA